MKKIAIVGSGIAGLTAGYLLSRKYEITLFEANDYFGGHTHTHEIQEINDILNIDTGFIVFNQLTYPLFIKLLKELGVAYQESDMSFSVYDQTENYFYSGRTLNSLFAQRKNFFSKKHWMLLGKIIRFNKKCIEFYKNQNIPQQTLGEFLKICDETNILGKYYVLPMVSAIWSSGLGSASDMPLKFFIDFFINHKLFNIINRPAWYTVTNGSSAYIKPILSKIKNKQLQSKVEAIFIKKDNVSLQLADGETHDFDAIVFATHANQTKAIIQNTDTSLYDALDYFSYSHNEVVLHQDMSLLPPHKNAYASWNYNLGVESEERTTLTYYMNMLQQLKAEQHYCVSVNPRATINESKILKEMTYQHPIYNKNTLIGQQKLKSVNGSSKIYCCGAYMGNGFHEDGVKSAVDIAEMLGVTWRD